VFGHPCFNTLKPTSYLRTTRFNIQITTFCPHSTLYVLCGSQNKRHYFLYSVNWFVFITETECLSSVMGHVKAQVVSRRSLAAEARVQSQVMCGQNSIATDFSPSISVCPRPYHSTDASYSCSSTGSPYQKDKRAKHRNLPKSSALSEFSSLIMSALIYILR